MRELRPVREYPSEHETRHFDGLANLLFPAVILVAVFVDHPSLPANASRGRLFGDAVYFGSGVRCS